MAFINLIDCLLLPACTTDTQDILICGNCKEVFSGIQKLVEHKKTKCRLRFACRCHSYDSRKGKESVNNGMIIFFL